MQGLIKDGRVGLRLAVLILEGLLAIPILGWSLFLIGPWFESDDPSIIGEVLSTTPGRFIWAAIYFVPVAALAYGLYKRINDCRMQAMMGLSLCYLFLAALRIVVHGIFPLTWLYTLTFALLCGALYLLERIYDD